MFVFCALRLPDFGYEIVHMTHTFAPPGPQTKPRRFATLRTVLALMLREMATTYGRSPGGYL